MRSAHHAEVALIFGRAVLDPQLVAIAKAADLVLVAVFQLLGAFVPGERDLRIVDADAALEGGALVLSCCLISDVLQHGDRLKIQVTVIINSERLSKYFRLGLNQMNPVKLMLVLILNPDLTLVHKIVYLQCLLLPLYQHVLPAV